MTTLGKILVVLNLVFSLAVAAFIITFFTTSTNWKEGHDQKKDQRDAAVANARAAIDQRDTAILESAAQVAGARDQLDRATKELEAAKATLAAKEAENQNLTRKSNAADIALAKLGEDVKKRAEEVKQLEQYLADATKRNLEVVQEMNRQRDRAVAAEIKLRTMQDHNERLVVRLEQMEKEMIRAKNGGTAVASTNQRNPPSDQVEGLIKQTDSSSGLVTITIGSDSGIARGHTLEVFRLATVPSQSRYKGTIRILEVRPNEAVGTPLQRPLAPLEVGDRVSSRIMPG